MIHVKARTLLFSAACCNAFLSFAATPPIWQGYYQTAKPIQQTTKASFCHEHTPGVFIHTINDMITKPVKTNRGITLSNAIFNQDHVGKVYLIYGELTASGPNNGWHDNIHYVLYKFSKNGITRGVWYTNKCKGTYIGTVVPKRKNIATA